MRERCDLCKPIMYCENRGKNKRLITAIVNNNLVLPSEKELKELKVIARKPIEECELFKR